MLGARRPFSSSARRSNLPWRPCRMSRICIQKAGECEGYDGAINERIFVALQLQRRKWQRSLVARGRGSQPHRRAGKAPLMLDRNGTLAGCPVALVARRCQRGTSAASLRAKFNG